MRILIATGIFPPDIGGPATMLAHLARSLDEHGFEIRILTYSGENTRFINGQIKDAIKVFRVKKNNKLKYFFQLLKLSKWADLIYATDTYSAGYFVDLIKKLTGKKYILRFTGDSAWEISRANGWIKDYIMDFQIKKYNHKIECLKKRRNKILFNAERIVVDCKFNKRLAVSAVYSDERSDEGSHEIQEYKNKIFVIYNAVDFDNLDPYHSVETANKIKQRFSPNNEKILLTSCRLTLWKGVDKIIEILSELIKNIGPMNFLILGNGPELENLKNLTKKLSLENNVHFLGKIQHGEIHAYFQATDCFVLNSQYEGASHALLDAMQIGVPIVTTKVGGNPELIENNKDGILIEYGHKQEMLEAFVKILQDKNLAENFSNNASKKAKKFTWKNVVRETKKILITIA